MTALAGDRSRRVELACFAALAALTTLQWASLVAHPPAGRVTVAVLVATGAGAVIAAIARLPGRRQARWALAGAATAVALCLGMVVVGLPARLLLPGHWDELGSNVSRSLDGLSDVPVPYAGADTWTRLVILLAGPLVVGLASFAAFWPTRRRVAGRICALVLLVALYLVAVAWATPGRQLAGGALLLILVCAWLWLPGIAPASRPAALAAVGVAGVLALPVAAAVAPGRGLIDYRHWALLSANGQSFQLGPDLRAAELAPEGHAAARGRQRRRPLLEGDQSRQLRRHPLGALNGRRSRAGPGRAAGLSPEGNGPPPRS